MLIAVVWITTSSAFNTKLHTHIHTHTLSQKTSVADEGAIDKNFEHKTIEWRKEEPFQPGLMCIPSTSADCLLDASRQTSAATKRNPAKNWWSNRAAAGATLTQLDHSIHPARLLILVFRGGGVRRSIHSKIVRNNQSRCSSHLEKGKNSLRKKNSFKEDFASHDFPFVHCGHSTAPAAQVKFYPFDDRFLDGKINILSSF